MKSLKVFLFFFLFLQSLAFGSEIALSGKKSVLLQTDEVSLSAQSESEVSQEDVVVGFVEQLSKILEDTKRVIESNFSRWANRELIETPTAFASRQRRLTKAFSDTAKTYCQLLETLSESENIDYEKHRQLCQQFLDFSTRISQRAEEMKGSLRQARGKKKP